MVNGKEKLLYLIEHYKTGDYSTNLFCDLYTKIFNTETDDCEFTDEEWDYYERFMEIASRYSPYKDDFVEYPNAYNNTEMVNRAFMKLYRCIHPA